MSTLSARTPQQIDDLEENLNNLEQRITQMNEYFETLQQSNLQLTELRHVLKESSVFFAQVWNIFFTSPPFFKNLYIYRLNHAYKIQRLFYKKSMTMLSNKQIII